MHRQPHILNASSNLLGISLILITGLKVTHHSGQAFADECAGISALGFTASCLLSYLAMRNERRSETMADLSDWSFLSGLALLVIAVVNLAFSKLV